MRERTKTAMEGQQLKLVDPLEFQRGLRSDLRHGRDVREGTARGLRQSVRQLSEERETVADRSIDRPTYVPSPSGRSRG